MDGDRALSLETLKTQLVDCHAFQLYLEDIQLKNVFFSELAHRQLGVLQKQATQADLHEKGGTSCRSFTDLNCRRICTSPSLGV